MGAKRVRRPCVSYAVSARYTAGVYAPAVFVLATLRDGRKGASFASPFAESFGAKKRKMSLIIAVHTRFNNRI